MSPTWLLWVSLFLFVNGDECPSDADLRKIVTKFAKVVPLKSIDGAWMVVQAPEVEVKEMTASYSTFDINEAKTEVEISVHDFMKSEGQNMYFQSMKIKPGSENKVISWTGRYSDDSIINKDTIFFYADPHVLGYYSCEPGLAMDKGWTVRILVNAANRKDLLAGEENIKKALKAASDQLDAMKAEDDKWKAAHDGKFGLFGPITQMEFNDLMPEKYNPGEEDGRIM